MKKHAPRIAALAALAGGAQAQSSVTVYGTLDVQARCVKADGQTRCFSEATDGLNSSQLAFKGVEDLGDGLKAGFTLLSGVNSDTGTANSKIWNRRSTVSLFGKVGEVRLGRDHTPTFWSQAIFDAFGHLGLGNPGNVRQRYVGTRIGHASGPFDVACAASGQRHAEDLQSKRTALYATASRLSNKDGTNITLPGAAGATTAKGKSQDAEFGLRHFF